MINPTPEALGLFAVCLYAFATIPQAFAQESDNTSQFDEAKALQVIALMEEAEIGEPMTEGFLNAGGMFDIEVTDSANATYKEGTAFTDPAIKIAPRYFDSDGNLVKYFNENGDIANNDRLLLMNDLAHEFFHAYVDQVAEEGHDADTEAIMVKGVSWFRNQEVLAPTGSEMIPIPSWAYCVEEARDGNDMSAKECESEFFEEYTAKILNKLVFTHQIIARKLRKQRVNVNEAAQAWEEALERIREAQYRGYYGPDAPQILVLANPPDFLTRIIHAGHEI